MTGMLVCLSAALLGVDYGWRPLPDGGIEYIIQIEPHMLDSLQDGKGLTSALPGSRHDIRRYRIVVGTGELPHQGQPLPEAADGSKRQTARKVSPAGYDEPWARRALPGEPQGPSLSRMPLESPYPRDYEKTGVPLPGPAGEASLVAEETPSQPLEPPGWQRKLLNEPPAFDSHNTGKPLVRPRIPAVEEPEEAPALQNSADARPMQKAGGQERSLAAQKPTSGKRSSATAHDQTPAETSAPEEPRSPSDQPPPAAASAERQNSAALVGLFASLGGNVFLVWVASGQRNRYRALLRRSHEALAAASVNQLPSHDEPDDAPRWEPVGDASGARANARKRRD